jgi:hypothetical protein
MADKKDKKAILSKVVPLADKEIDQDIALLESFKKPFDEAREKLISKAVDQPEQLSFLPTQLCRSTIFFPLPRKGRKALQAEPVILPFKTQWGSGEYEGRRLSVDDEDILIACLYLAKKHDSKQFLTTYTGLQGLLGITPHPKYNSKIKDSLKRFGKASFSVDYKGNNDQWAVDHILKARAYKGKIRITFDSDFYQEFLRSYTLLSMPFRMKLKGDLTKLLFTFLSSHRTPVKYFTSTLAEALNMNPNGDKNKKYLSRKLRDAFKELQAKGFLIDFHYDSKQDIFTLKTIERKKWKELS